MTGRAAAKTGAPRGVGLRNTRDRLLVLYGEEQSFELRNRPRAAARCD